MAEMYLNLPVIGKLVDYVAIGIGAIAHHHEMSVEKFFDELEP